MTNHETLKLLVAPLLVLAGQGWRHSYKIIGLHLGVYI